MWGRSVSSSANDALRKRSNVSLTLVFLRIVFGARGTTMWIARNLCADAEERRAGRLSGGSFRRTS